MWLSSREECQLHPAFSNCPHPSHPPGLTHDSQSKAGEVNKLGLPSWPKMSEPLLALHAASVSPPAPPTRDNYFKSHLRKNSFERDVLNVEEECFHNEAINMLVR